MKKLLRLIKNTIILSVIVLLTFFGTVLGLYYKLSDPQGSQELSGVIKKPSVNVGSFAMGIVTNTKVTVGQSVNQGNEIATVLGEAGEEDATVIEASTNGKVEEIFVRDGGFVNKGASVLRLTKTNEAIIEVVDSVYSNSKISNEKDYAIIMNDKNLIKLHFSGMKIPQPNSQNATYTFTFVNIADAEKFEQAQTAKIVPLKVAVYRNLLFDFSRQVVELPVKLLANRELLSLR